MGKIRLMFNIGLFLLKKSIYYKNEIIFANFNLKLNKQKSVDILTITGINCKMILKSLLNHHLYKF